MERPLNEEHKDFCLLKLMNLVICIFFHYSLRQLEKSLTIFHILHKWVALCIESHRFTLFDRSRTLILWIYFRDLINFNELILTCCFIFECKHLTYLFSYLISKFNWNFKLGKVVLEVRILASFFSNCRRIKRISIIAFWNTYIVIIAIRATFCWIGWIVRWLFRILLIDFDNTVI